MVKQSCGCMDVLFTIIVKLLTEIMLFTTPAHLLPSCSCLTDWVSSESSESCSLESQKIMSVSHTQMPPPPENLVQSHTCRWCSVTCYQRAQGHALMGFIVSWGWDEMGCSPVTFVLSCWGRRGSVIHSYYWLLKAAQSRSSWWTKFDKILTFVLFVCSKPLYRSHTRSGRNTAIIMSRFYKRRVCDSTAQMGGRGNWEERLWWCKQRSGGACCILLSHSPIKCFMVGGVGCEANTLLLIYTPKAKIHT